MGFGLNLEYLGEMGRGVLLPTGIRRDAIGKFSDLNWMRSGGGMRRRNVPTHGVA